MLKMTAVANLTMQFVLLGCVGTFTLVGSQIQAQETVQREDSGNGYRALGVVKGRLKIPKLTSPLKVGEPNEIPIDLQGYAARSAHISVIYNGGYSSPSAGMADMEVVIKFHRDNSAYISFTPEKLGKLELQVLVKFDDGYIGTEELDTAEVILPDHKPDKFYADIGGHGTLYLDLTGKIGASMIDGFAVYSNAVHPVPIPPEYLKFKVIAEDESKPPVSIDNSTGKLTAIRYGHALVQTTFEDMSTLNCVSVQEDASSGANRLDCSELVPPGMTLPKTEVEELRRQFMKMLTTPRVQQH